MLRSRYGNEEGKGRLRAGYGSKDFQIKNIFNSAPSFNRV